MIRKCTILLVKELRQIVGSRTFLALSLTVSPFIGYSFIQAVALFAEASRSAIGHRELAPGMNPYTGVVLPTIGALYLVSTLLLPFLAVRPIATEKESGSIKLLAQLPFNWTTIVAVKTVSMMAVWVVLLLPVFIALIMWSFLGGHLYFAELLNLFLGHLLYASLVIGISFLAASLTRSISTAAIFVLAFTIGCWMIDFSATGYGIGLLEGLAGFSPTYLLKGFEKGIVSSTGVLRFAVLSITFLSIAGIWLQTGEAIPRRAIKSLFALAVAVSLLFVAQASPVYKDVTEDRRNSFPTEDEVALKEVAKPFQITVFLAPDDPRLRDLQSRLFEKLKRTMPKFSVKLGATGKTDFFGTGASDNYGLMVYEYEGRRIEHRSGSRSEVLSTIHKITGHKVPSSSSSEYPGYPLVAEVGRFSWCFYFFVPFLFLGLLWIANRTPKTRSLI